MTRDNLFKIKEQIEEAKTKHAETQGKLSSITEQMKDKFDVSTVDEARRELKKRAEELDTLENVFENDVKDLEKSYSWEV